MAYLVKKEIRGKNYFYLVSSVKINGRLKKFQIYIGPNKPSAKNLRKYSNILNRRVENYFLKTDPLLTIISKEESEKLKKLKERYRTILKESPAIKENYYEWFVSTYTYNSNAIEGSSLKLRETALLLFEGITPSNRPIRDVIAAENHKRTYDWMISYKGDINKQFILKLHKILTTGILSSTHSGKIRKVQVYVRGAEEIPPKAEDIESQLKVLLKRYNANKKKYHPIIVASYFHTAFEQIHPFVDFNGRTGRLLLNFILLKNGYPPVDIRNKDRYRYYSAIRTAIAGNLKPFVKLVMKYLNGLEDVLK